MGDRRFDPALAAVLSAPDRAQAIRSLDDEAIIEALAAASRSQDPLLANVLATEAENRIHRLRAALAHMAEGVAALDPTGRVRWMNPAAERLLRIAREDAVGKNFHTLIDHRDKTGSLVSHEECRILAVARSRSNVEAEGEYFVRPDRTKLCVAYTSAPTLDRNGDVSGIVVVFRDCGPQLDWTNSVLEARQRYQALYDQLPMPVATLDQYGTIVDVNHAAEAVTKRKREDARGHKFGTFLRPEHIDSASALFGEVMRGEPRTAHFDVLCGDGSFATVCAIGVPIRDGEQIRGVHCLFEPVSGGFSLRLAASFAQ
ncbi:MAG TPA: PAS domain-containing protein [Candidatus Thermoplasmatota archaeon]|nr:PAS domain-containing protein [Candidatus Thermoplasmatota archaeon]